MGTITLEELHKYHCNNPDRRLLCMFGKVYDVTSAIKSYGPDGAYKEYAGHDITLALSNHKTQDEWLDRFVKMKDKWYQDAKNWSEYFDGTYNSNSMVRLLFRSFYCVYYIRVSICRRFVCVCVCVCCAMGKMD